MKQKAEKNADLVTRIAELESALKSSKKKLKTLQKQQQRARSNTGTANTPRSKTKSSLRAENLKLKKVSNVKRTLEFHYALVNEIKVQAADKKIGKLLSSIAAGSILRKYQMLTKFRNAIKVCGMRKLRYVQKGSLSTRAKSMVRDFFLRCDVSRICPGMKETITRGGIKKQRRFMTDTLSNLYRKFVCTEEYVSLTTFWRLKPFYVLQPKDSDRQTCLCKVCDNFKLIATALYREGYIQTSRAETLVQQASCNITQKPCMYGDCSVCEDKEIEFLKHTGDEAISFYQWETIKENRKFKDGSEKSVTFVGKKLQTLTAIDARVLFKHQLKQNKRHFCNMKTQFEFYRNIKDNLQEDEALIHVDFAENYVCKWDAEIQSVHFGASKKQLSLHTGFFKVGGLKLSSFCGVSECLDHEPFAIWAFLSPILDKIKSEYPMVTRLHFFTAQYRQKVNFFLLSQITPELGFSFCSWNFFEAGHGKGIPDGVGATVKRAADRSVKFGNSICNAHDFVKFVSKSCSAVHLYTIKDNAIASLKQAHSTAFLKAVPTTIKLHQVLCYDKDGIEYRDLSCFCNEGYECDDTHLLKHHSFSKAQGKKFQTEKPSTRIKTEKRLAISFDNANLSVDERKIVHFDSVTSIGAEQEDRLQDKMILPVFDEFSFNDHSENSISDCREVNGMEKSKESTCNVSTERSVLSIPKGNTCQSNNKVEEADSEKGFIEENQSEVIEFQSDDGNFENEETRSAQFVMFLKELKECKSFDVLKKVCKCQMNLVTQSRVQGRERNVIASKLPIESRFQKHVPTDIPIQSGCRFPVKVRCDGDCLPACGAVFAFGKDIRAAEIRVRIVHELVENANFYLDNEYLSLGSERAGSDRKLCTEAFASFSDHYLPNVHDLTDKAVIKALYEKEILDICKPGSYMGIWQLFGLASVLRMRVCSVYPEVATIGSVRCNIHRLIEPRVRASDGIANILWTSTNNSNVKSLYWRPNHFVPLLPFNGKI